MTIYMDRADEDRAEQTITDEPVRRRHTGPCPECNGTEVVLHGGRVLECLGCGWEWAYTSSAKGRHYPNMPPLLDGEGRDHYSNRLIGVYGETPYDHVRNRECSLGWHDSCSERASVRRRRCQCPCHGGAGVTDKFTEPWWSDGA